jgi:hypothetical protein
VDLKAMLINFAALELARAKVGRMSAMLGTARLAGP